MKKLSKEIRTDGRAALNRDEPRDLLESKTVRPLRDSELKTTSGGRFHQVALCW